MNATSLLATRNPFEVPTPTGYIIGTLIALVIFGYLLYSLVKPGKF